MPANELRYDKHSPFWQDLGDEWRMEEVIGQGGQATVYRATERKGVKDPKTGRTKCYAVKVMRDPPLKTYQKKDGRVVTRPTEWYILSDLLPPHDNIVGFKTAQGSSREKLWNISLSLYDGDLASLIHDNTTSEKGVPEAFTYSMFLQVAKGLDWCHRYGLRHSDLKPNNVLYFWPDKHPRSQCYPVMAITDFGAASFSTDGSKGSGFWTEGYEPPEGPKEVSYAYDIWSLGCMVHYAICGDTPRRHKLTYPPKSCSPAVELRMLHCLKWHARDRVSAYSLVKDLEKDKYLIDQFFRPLRKTTRSARGIHEGPNARR